MRKDSIYYSILVIVLLSVWGCGSDPSASVDFGPGVEVSVPTRISGEPNLFRNSEGAVYLSWTEYPDDSTSSLLLSKLEGDQWSSPVEIARGSDWFVNWADFPAVSAFLHRPGSMVAHWLQKSSSGTYDYDIYYSFSEDGGKHWSEGKILNDDGIPAEHGFVSFLPYEEVIYAFYLDGRNTKSHDLDTPHGHGGAMTLRVATIDQDGHVSPTRELDDRVCDCCQTAAVVTDKGPMVVYRDRSPDEVRDIATVRYFDSKWSSPSLISVDQWKIEGCPVNGPAITANEDDVAVVWYTEAENPAIYLALSEDGGLSFGPAIPIDTATLGRVDIHFLDDNFLTIIAIKAAGNESKVLAYVYDVRLRQFIEVIELVEIDPRRSSGFPRFVVDDEYFILTYTEVEEDSTRIKTKIFEWKNNI